MIRFLTWSLVVGVVWAQDLPRVSGVYPHLAMFNDENECGTGAVVHWAGRIWAITYAPHKPRGSSDKLYEITPDLKQIIRPESVGGTPAARLIHRESRQLFIGPYVIDKFHNVRVIPPSRMPGRLTGIARHLHEPERYVYYATMEEGLYEVDVKTLEVKELFADDHEKGDRRRAKLPGYHGKGLASGQGRLVYANNGERGKAARTNPETPSGCLAEWDGKSDTWKVIRRNQFTDVTGPGTIHGNFDPVNDPLWSIGWDHRSLILMLLDEGRWSSFRLPKPSHAYDGAHGWNTEWPRIGDVGERGLLMTMHGAFWHFPRGFRRGKTRGILPRSAYLKVIGDFGRWGDNFVFGCDDTARAEFLNTRRAKGKIKGPGQSQSNLWFVKPERMAALGPVHARGAVWLGDDLAAGATSDPFLVDGFPRRTLHLDHASWGTPATFTLEADAGDGKWKKLRYVRRGSTVLDLADDVAWVRLRVDRAVEDVAAVFHCAQVDKWPALQSSDRFRGLASSRAVPQTGGLVRARGANLGTLALVGMRSDGAEVTETGFYELHADLTLRRKDDAAALKWTRAAVPIPKGVLQHDAASVIYVDDDGRRWRLPRGAGDHDQPGAFGAERIDREVVTERDLFHAYGTFYELPARNAGGFARIRPIASHTFRVHDYASWRGLLVMTGVSADAKHERIIRSDDGLAAVWVGVVDDLWELGRPVGTGGPWKGTKVAANVPSDPYLMTGYDEKTLRLEASGPVEIAIEVDVTGTGRWIPYRSFRVLGDEPVHHAFPTGFQACWVRAVASAATTATVQFSYH